MLSRPRPSRVKLSVGASDLPQVVATTSVLCDLAQQIAQDTVALTCLVEAGQDPHTYATKPSDRRAIDEADLVLYDGYDATSELIQIVETSSNPAPKVAVYEAAVPEPLMGEAHDHGHDHEDDPEHEATEHSEAEASHGEDDHAEEGKPSAARLTELVDAVKASGVPAIFAETTSHTKLIETLANDADVVVAENPLFVEGPGGPGTSAETIQTMLVVNTCTVVNALGGECAEAEAPL